MILIPKLFSLKNKVVVVTGSNGQLGKCIIDNLKEEVKQIYALDIKRNQKTDKKFNYINTDICSSSDFYDALNTINKNSGKIDILINNAGVTTFKPLEDRRSKDIDLIMNVNLKGTLNGIKNYSQIFTENNYNNGCIINIASIYGIISPDFRVYNDGDNINSEIYGATKAGVIQMTKYFSVYFANKNIRVNSISPGGIYNPLNPQSEDFVRKYSDRVPLGRMANQEELLGGIIYLASDASKYVTGHNLVIDGGLSVW